MWQAQYFCVVVRGWVAFLVGGAALRRPPASFGVAGVALQTCRVACFLRIALSGLHQVVTTCKFRGLRGILWDFEVVSLGFVRKEVLMWYCVAGVAHRDILTCLKKCRKSFCVTRAILSQGFQKMSRISPGRRNALDTSIVILCGRCSTLDVCSCEFFANHNASAAWSSDNEQIAWQAWQDIVRL